MWAVDLACKINVLARSALFPLLRRKKYDKDALRHFP
jgi:hypothetical protein